MKREPRETIAESLMGQYNYFGRWFAMADIVLQGLDSAGLVVVSAEDQRTMLGLLAELSDSEPCWFDHDGGCQAHGPTSTWPRCPHAHARELLAALPERTDHA